MLFACSLRALLLAPAYLLPLAPQGAPAWLSRARLVLLGVGNANWTSGKGCFGPNRGCIVRLQARAAPIFLKVSHSSIMAERSQHAARHHAWSVPAPLCERNKVEDLTREYSKHALPQAERPLSPPLLTPHRAG